MLCYSGEAMTRIRSIENSAEKLLMLLDFQEEMLQENTFFHHTGFISYVYNQHENSVYVTKFYVKPKFRGQGYSYNFGEYMIELFKEMGIVSIYADIQKGYPRHKNRLNFFINMGFDVYNEDEDTIFFHRLVNE